MSYLRREPTYLHSDVWKACWLIGQACSGKPDIQGLAKNVSADEVADTLLRGVLVEKYPQLMEHLKAVAKLDGEIIKTLGAKPT